MPCTWSLTALEGASYAAKRFPFCGATVRNNGTVMPRSECRGCGRRGNREIEVATRPITPEETAHVDELIGRARVALKAFEKASRFGFYSPLEFIPRSGKVTEYEDCRFGL